VGKKAGIVGGVAASLFLLLAIPFPMVVGRNCTILVIDSAGKPWANANVSRGWAYGSPETLEHGQTGPNGTVTFDSRVQKHSVLGRCLATVANVAVVHGSAHIDDEYLVSIPEGYTAEIQGDAPFKWVYEEGHFAKVDLEGLPRDEHHRVKFVLKRKTADLK
jgi:hypothetical protein